MLTLEAAKAAVSPYLLLIKLGLVAALFLGGVFTGCQWQETRDDKKIATAETNVKYYQGQAVEVNKALVAMSDQAEANAAQAESQKAQADKAVQEAAAAKLKLDKQQSKWEKEFERIYKNPDCKRILEQKLCPLITDF